MNGQDDTTAIGADISVKLQALCEMFEAEFIDQSPAVFEDQFGELPYWKKLQKTMLNRIPVAHRMDNGKILLAVPIISMGTVKRIASAELASATHESLTERLAEAAFVLNEQRSEVEQRDEHIRLFTEQLSSNFEEVTWLLSLSEDLGHCTANNRLEDLAAKAIPALRDVLQAEAVTLVRCAEGSSSPGTFAEELDFPVWVGRRIVSPQQCAEFITTIVGGARQKPFVWNFDSRVSKQSQPELAEDIHSCILVEIRNEEHHYGWILVLNKIAPAHDRTHASTDRKTLGLNEFGTKEATLVRSAAQMMASHSTNVRMFREQRDFTVGVIRSMINVVDLRDKYTRGHSDRVALMARSLAGFLGLSKSDQRDFHLSGLLHDVGKIGIPDAVLLKPGNLTDEEFDVIKQHPEQGVEILKHIRQLEHILPGVLHHHESWNGSGYPHGLAGEEIPLMGRVLAVVDVYDAITTCRPYREARTSEDAAAILREGSGRQWDPEITAVFLANLECITKSCLDYIPTDFTAAEPLADHDDVRVLT